MLDNFAEIINKVRDDRPLVECITNKVTINDCANAILAVGASAVMTEDVNELSDIVKKAKSVVINIGTLNESMYESIKMCGRLANKHSVPIVFDPVGVGGSYHRTIMAKKFLKCFKPSIIRGNISEIKALLGVKSNLCGVDSAKSDTVTKENATLFSKIVRRCAVEYDCVVCATSAVDLVSDGTDIIKIDRGSKMLRDITGSGCMTSAICGAYLACAKPLQAAVLALLNVNISGEFAERYVKENNCGTGTFRIKLMDYISKFDESVIY